MLLWLSFIIISLAWVSHVRCGLVDEQIIFTSIEVNITTYLDSASHTTITCDSFSSCYSYNLTCVNNTWNSDDCYIDFSVEFRSGWAILAIYDDTSQQYLSDVSPIQNNEVITTYTNSTGLAWCFSYSPNVTSVSRIGRFRQYCYEENGCKNNITFETIWALNTCGIKYISKDMCTNSCQDFLQVGKCVYSKFSNNTADPQACLDLHGPFIPHKNTTACKNYDTCSFDDDRYCYNGNCVNSIYEHVFSTFQLNTTTYQRIKDSTMCTPWNPCYNYTLRCLHNNWKTKGCFIDFSFDFPSGQTIQIALTNETEKHLTEMTFISNSATEIAPNWQSVYWCFPYNSLAYSTHIGRFRVYCLQEHCSNEVTFYKSWDVKDCGIRWKEKNMCVNNCQDYGKVATCVYTNNKNHAADPQACVDIYGPYPEHINKSACHDYQSCSFDDSSQVCLNGDCLNPCSVVDCGPGQCYEYRNNNYFCHCPDHTYGEFCQYSYVTTLLYCLLALMITPLISCVYTFRSRRNHYLRLSDINNSNAAKEEKEEDELNYKIMAIINLKKMISKVFSLIGFYAFIKALHYGNYYIPPVDDDIEITDYNTALQSIYKLSLVGIFSDGLATLVLVTIIYLNILDIKKNPTKYTLVSYYQKKIRWMKKILPFSEESKKENIEGDVECRMDTIIREEADDRFNQNVNAANSYNTVSRVDVMENEVDLESDQPLPHMNNKQLVKSQEEKVDTQDEIVRESNMEVIEKEKSPQYPSTSDLPLAFLVNPNVNVIDCDDGLDKSLDEVIKDNTSAKQPQLDAMRSMLSMNSVRDFTKNFKDNPFGNIWIFLLWFLSALGMICSCGTVIAIQSLLTPSFAYGDDDTGLQERIQIYRLFSPFGIICHIISAFAGMVGGGILFGTVIAMWQAGVKDNKKSFSIFRLMTFRDGRNVVYMFLVAFFVIVYVISLYITFGVGVAILTGN
jgi:hypothetical protein